MVGDVPENCCCTVCHEVHFDIIKLQNCKHSMCQSCFTKRSKKNLMFCTCSALVEEAPEEATLELKFLLKDLIVVCPRRCGEPIKLGEVSFHVDNVCPMAIVQCGHKDCFRRLKRMELIDHMKICDFRTVPCEGCGKNLRFVDLRKHQISMGCMNRRCKQTVVKQMRNSDKNLKQYINNIKQDTFKTLRDERALEKGYMWRRIERNPDRFSPTLVLQGGNENHFNGFVAPVSIQIPNDRCSRESNVLASAREQQISSAEFQVCKTCFKTYSLRSNHSEACTWHEGVGFSMFHATTVEEKFLILQSMFVACKRFEIQLSSKKVID